MKNKNRNKKINILFQKALLVFVVAVLFCFGKNVFSKDVETCLDKIIINEIYPFTDNEFVEVRNAGGRDCSLDDWSVSDSLDDKHRKYFDNQIIESSSYIVIEGNLYLNDSGDEVKLWNESGELKEVKKYEKEKDQGKSFSLIDDDWIWGKITKGKENEDETEKQDEKNSNICKKDNIYLNEINPFGDEFVEVYNDGSECSLNGWRIEDNASHKVYFESDSIINNKETLVLYGKYLLNDSSSDGANLVDSCGEFIEKVEYEKPKDEDKNKTYSKFENEWQWAESSPGKENVREVLSDPKDFKKDNYSTKIRINEVLPNPKGSDADGEYIELYNFGNNETYLNGWKIKDRVGDAKNGKWKIIEIKNDFIVPAKGYLLLKRDKIKFSLSSDDKIILLDPNENEIDAVEYSGAKEEIAYSFDGKKWRWSVSTPGEKNKFGDLPKIEVEKPKEIYLNVYADFEVKINYSNKNKIKVTWDFGDEHKSYKKETRHKYLKKGIYDASVKVSNGVEDVIEDFKVNIEEYSHPKVKIVKVDPNPFGKDSKMETITIKNQSKKKINLLGWSIATGWDKLYNHPINFDFEIKPGKEKELSRDFAAFSLNNKKAKIELRYPDGKVADDMKYKNKKSIEEGMFFVKKKGSGWQWVATQKARSNKQEAINKGQNSMISEYVSANKNQAENTDNTPSNDIGKFSQIKQKNKIEEVKAEIDQIKFSAEKSGKLQVLGVQALRVENESYRFTQDYPTPPHYVVAFIGSLLQNTNNLVNDFINYLFS